MRNFQIFWKKFPPKKIFKILKLAALPRNFQNFILVKKQVICDMRPIFKIEKRNFDMKKSDLSLNTPILKTKKLQNICSPNIWKLLISGHPAHQISQKLYFTIFSVTDILWLLTFWCAIRPEINNFKSFGKEMFWSCSFFNMRSFQDKLTFWEAFL